MVHSDSDLILHNSSVLIDKEPFYKEKENKLQAFQAEGLSSFRLIYIIHDCKRVFTSMRSDNRIRMQYRDMHVRE